MPKGIRKEPCEVCGSNSTNCSRSKEHLAKLKGAKAVPKARATKKAFEKRLAERGALVADVMDARAPAPPAAANFTPAPDLKAYTLDALVELRLAVDAELRSRRDQALRDAKLAEEALERAESAATASAA
jgi:hypothetical protein